MLCLAGLACLALAAAPSAQTMPSRGIECQDYEEMQAFQNIDGVYVPMEIGSPTARARCWGLETNYADSCNKVDWPVTLKHEASVAQWMIIGMNYDGFHWGVRKPGEYTAGCVDLFCRSNYEIEVTGEGFEDLVPLEPDDTIDSLIEVKYALTDNCETPPAPDDPAWLTAAQMNDLDFEIEDSYDLHWTGWTTHIWASINVSPCNGPTDWFDPDWATITLSLDEQQPWIDPETGEFGTMPEFPFQ